ncbi:hypothetical protein J2X43_002513 [Rhizobium sp. BE258]|nr:hypothetical protein [Rhizobium sp. BE258]
MASGGECYRMPQMISGSKGLGQLCEEARKTANCASNARL